MKMKVMGCQVDNLTMEETLSRIEEFITNGHCCQHVVVNVDKVVKANRDERLLDIINNCDLVNTDGMPVVWASRLLGNPLKERVTGIDLFTRLVERSVEKQWSLFFLGARQEIVTKVVSMFKKEYPSLKVAGYRNGYWPPEEEQDVVEEIKRAEPDILFVAISSPKKEEFLDNYLKYMNVPFAMGVGGSFDVLAGLTKRAPLWMQRSGFEWFYRFLQEPRRMFKRYFLDDPYFFWLLLKDMVRK